MIGIILIGQWQQNALLAHSKERFKSSMKSCFKISVFHLVLVIFLSKCHELSAIINLLLFKNYFHVHFDNSLSM